MARQLSCPCGTVITSTEEDFLHVVRGHLTTEHPGRDYSDNEILMISREVPDRLVDQQ